MYAEVGNIEVQATPDGGLVEISVYVEYSHTNGLLWASEARELAEILLRAADEAEPKED